MANLFVVATPIGNLGDISPRSAETLADCKVIAAESVARCRKLLSHLGLGGKKIISCREANRQRSADDVAGWLDGGCDVALVSDAGTPGISDPGAVVVRRAVEAGHRVCPIPGPSAAAAALSVAGLEPSPVVLIGFLPPKTKARREVLQNAVQTGWPMLIFEGPHRLARTAEDLLAVVGDRPVMVGRELSKIHEQVVHTTCSGLAQAASENGAKGEYTLVIYGGEPPRPNPEDIDRLLRQGLERADASPSELARQVAQATGRTRKEVYRRLMEIKDMAEIDCSQD